MSFKRFQKVVVLTALLSSAAGASDPMTLAQAKSFAVLDLLPSIDVPGLPASLPLPLYTIRVAQPGLTADYPAIVGSKSRVIIYNAAHTAVDTLSILLTQDVTDTSSYKFVVQRESGSSCTPIPANVTAMISLVPVTAVTKTDTQRMGTLGYSTWALGRGGTENTPQSFTINFTSTDSGMKVQVQQYSCTSSPLNLVGSFTDESENLQLLGTMTTRTNLVSSSIKAKNSATKLYTFEANEPVPLLSITGTRQSKPFRISLANLPESVELCSDSKAGTCNEPWRTIDEKKDSLKSFRFDAHRTTGVPQSVSVDINMTNVAKDGGNDRHVVFTNVVASHLGYDQHLSVSANDFQFYNPFDDGDWPKWIYVNTNGLALSGTILSEDVLNGARQHYFSLASPAPGFSAGNREIVANRKLVLASLSNPTPHTEYSVDRYGWMSCPSGFNISSDKAPGAIIDFAQYLLCH